MITFAAFDNGYTYFNGKYFSITFLTYLYVVQGIEILVQYFKYVKLFLD